MQFLREHRLLNFTAVARGVKPLDTGARGDAKHFAKAPIRRDNIIIALVSIFASLQNCKCQRKS